MPVKGMGPVPNPLRFAGFDRDYPPISVTIPVSVREILLGRRTIHRFENRPVEYDAVERALECAVRAPNHKLTSPWKFFLPGPETISAVIDLNTELLLRTKGASSADHKRKSWSSMPGWLIVACRLSDDELRHREDYAACACAVQNFMLSLWSEGIGSKWSSGPVTREPRLLELMGLDPGEHEVVALVWFGYPDEAPATQRAGYEAVTVRLR